MPDGKNVSKSLSRHDLPQFYLLVILYFLQGIPVGLAFGTVPFLLKSLVKETSFTSLGLFSMATYPYSLKILWSPIVDSFYNKRIGRRRSWIIPIQLISGIILWLIGWGISNNLIFEGVDNPFHGRDTDVKTNITQLVFWFGLLVILCATQDIAVDGWALTILSKRSLSYASTAQTVGLNIGYFLSFTIFLSLNSSEFVNKYFRNVNKPYGLVSLGGYMKFAGTIYILITVYIIFCTKEHPLATEQTLSNGHLPSNIDQIKEFELKQIEIIEYNDFNELNTENTQDITYIYRCFIKALKLKSVQSLAIIHLISKLAFQCNEGATNLKLLEKGFKREDLAVTVLIDVPFEIIFGYYVAKWSSDGGIEKKEDEQHGSILRAKQLEKNIMKRITSVLVGDAGVLTPWLYGFLGKLVAAMLGSYVLKMYPEDNKITTSYFLLVIVQHLLGSFMSTVQFVGISAFHTRIADPILGGTYMTLLNTLSNLGGTWPKIFIMSMISKLTTYECHITGKDKDTIEIVHVGMEICTKTLGGEVHILKDGYYITNIICIILGTILYFGFLKKKAQQLQKLPISDWRCT
ncbi:hypothetical protein KAFR_0G02250 [Kazachstania africana CBS 2517]|uniref:Acetyl-coenzyme A transporter 1 n=1 Tax=Kazachstania africana (strain ATCC 22294 / BCRC 22015 / CBS 2517 / CECT 1963 / NBRC 1671 / NRRL Y-8276) TaxID=1071382 RepID=H2AY09_KAZAF|nr:hypothetical protein KAFR_0G02250 [Kazachstania africana CBS 2517]CCF59259.1 hypothetical protein KAFR_0G02250 [Kazachstania africana CBS 2517]